MMCSNYVNTAAVADKFGLIRLKIAERAYL